MKLVRIEERDLNPANKVSSWGKRPLNNEIHVKEPSPCVLEKMIAMANINEELDTIVVYK